MTEPALGGPPLGAGSVPAVRCPRAEARVAVAPGGGAMVVVASAHSEEEHFPRREDLRNLSAPVRRPPHISLKLNLV